MSKSSFINHVNMANAQVVVALTCFVAFTVSVSAEYLFGKLPCMLCLITRFSYLAVSIISFLSFKYRRDFLDGVLFLCTFSLMCFAMYHLGVENHWWAGPAGCTVDLLPTIDKIFDKSVSQVRCDVANWKIFGISSTLYNFIMISGLFWIVSISISVKLAQLKNNITS